MATPKLTSLVYTLSHGGKHPLMHARHPSYPNIIGAGGTALLAGRDWQATYRLLLARKGGAAMPTSTSMLLTSRENDRYSISFAAL